jgi:transposase
LAHLPVQKIPCDIARANAAFGAHKKGERVRELIEQRGCELLFLPPYSPDLNPIEESL